MAKDLREQADKWMDANPQVYALFVRFATAMASRKKRFGIGQLTERVRWECYYMYDKGDFKINNNHRAYIARRMVAEHPYLEKFISFRAVRS